MAALASAVMLPAMLLKFTDLIDSTWTIAIERADQAGIELAHALITSRFRSMDRRLVGYFTSY